MQKTNPGKKIKPGLILLLVELKANEDKNYTAVFRAKF